MIAQEKELPQIDLSGDVVLQTNQEEIDVSHEFKKENKDVEKDNHQNFEQPDSSFVISEEQKNDSLIDFSGFEDKKIRMMMESVYYEIRYMMFWKRFSRYMPKTIIIAFSTVIDVILLLDVIFIFTLYGPTISPLQTLSKVIVPSIMLTKDFFLALFANMNLIGFKYKRMTGPGSLIMFFFFSVICANFRILIYVFMIKAQLRALPILMLMSLIAISLLYGTLLTNNVMSKIQIQLNKIINNSPKQFHSNSLGSAGSLELPLLEGSTDINHS